MADLADKWPGEEFVFIAVCLCALEGTSCARISRTTTIFTKDWIGAFWTHFWYPCRWKLIPGLPHKVENLSVVNNLFLTY